MIVDLLNSARRGFHPAADCNGWAWPDGSNTLRPAGTPICAGKGRLVVWAVTADLDWHGNEWKLPHHAANNPCWLCQAGRAETSEYPITAVGASAPWKRSVLTAEQALRQLPSTHRIMELAGLTAWHFAPDLMHTGCLGVVQYVFGSTLFEWVFEKDFHNRPDTALGMVWEIIQERYSQFGYRESIHKPHKGYGSPTSRCSLPVCESS